MLRKTLLAAVLAAAVAAGLATRPLEGRWLDRLASAMLSARVGAEVGLEGARLSGWRRLEFKRLTLSQTDPPRTLARSGEGLMLLGATPSIAMSDVRITDAPGFLRGLGLESDDAPAISSLLLRVGQKGPLTQVRVLRCEAADVRMNGGLQFTGRRLHKAHLLLRSTSTLWRSVPSPWERRLIRYRDGSRGVRADFFARTMRVSGRSGPIVEFGWQA